MKTNHPQGRFSIEYEIDSFTRGIAADLRRPVGTEVQWWVYDSATSQADAIYDVGSTATGRVWKSPIQVPVINAQVFQGVTVPNERGFYNVDVLRVSAIMNEILDLIPDITDSPDNHIKDRVVYRGAVYRPTRLYMRGQVISTYTILTLDLTQVAPEEMVNDDQFLSYSA
jgi:hypothetical protein